MIILIRCHSCKKLTNVTDSSITEKMSIFEFMDVPCSWCNKNMTLSEYDIFHSGAHHTIEDKILEEFFLSGLEGLPLEELKSRKVKYS